MFEILAYWFSITALTALYLLPVLLIFGSITSAWLERILRKSAMTGCVRNNIIRKLHNIYTAPIRFLDDVGGEGLIVFICAMAGLLWISTIVGAIEVDAYDSGYFDGVIWWFNEVSTTVAPYISYVVPFIIIGIIAEWVLPKTINGFLKVQGAVDKLSGDK